jgi:hypothetical protein
MTYNTGIAILLWPLHNKKARAKPERDTGMAILLWPLHNPVEKRLSARREEAPGVRDYKRPFADVPLREGRVLPPGAAAGFSLGADA